MKSHFLSFFLFFLFPFLSLLSLLSFLSFLSFHFTFFFFSLLRHVNKRVLFTCKWSINVHFSLSLTTDFSRDFLSLYERYVQSFDPEGIASERVFSGSSKVLRAQLQTTRAFRRVRDEGCPFHSPERSITQNVIISPFFLSFCKFLISLMLVLYCPYSLFLSSILTLFKPPPPHKTHSIGGQSHPEQSQICNRQGSSELQPPPPLNER